MVTSAATSSVLPDGIRLRNFRPSDSEEIRRLFPLVMAEHPNSPLRDILRASLFHPPSFAAYAVITTGFGLCFYSPEYMTIGPLVSMTGLLLLLGYRRMVWNFHMNFFIYVVNGELSDIPGHYKLEPSDSNVDEIIPSGPGGFWVAEKEWRDGHKPQIVGYVGLEYIIKDGKPHADVRRMIVSPDHRRQGIAIHLMRRLIAHARTHGVPAITLHTLPDATAAMKMYRQLGWVEQESLYVRDGLIRTVLIKFRLDLVD